METHIIHKVYLELTTSSVSEAKKIKENIGSFLNTEVFPLLEKQMDAIDKEIPEYTIQLDQIHVEIAEKNIRLNDDLKYTLIERVETETKKELQTINDNHKTEDSIVRKRKLGNKNEHQLETFIHFLKTGTNPWWSNESITQLVLPKNFKKLLTTRDFIPKVVRVLRDEKVRSRFINQLTMASVKELCLAIAQKSEILNIKEAEVQKISKRPIQQQQGIWEVILTAIAHQEAVDVTAIIVAVKEAVDLSKHTQKQSQEKTISRENQETANSTQDTDQTKQQTVDKKLIEALVNPKKEEVATRETSIKNEEVIEGEYVQNAGLVLIHPFLKHFFSHCNLLDEDKQLKDPERCAHLLHYIATGRTKQAESDMVFEKFLCNIPINQSINRNITITKKQKEQVNTLLNAVNENWGALKKTSHALLQNEFLQRLGKIEKNSSGITIQIEKKTQDILLKKLSWGMGLIRLPWKKEFLYVNW
ncbi:hypothetical protein GCM10011344_28750 [Dokdonia pacifica]|uniref:Uncharacterized protein n=1 Tax=Dokdonia pacifica TaxID=1627892 RepID=A0A239C790_9FLAO|nr:contractile injection system tape measure protein [Dokdonia pacifica]GGG26277.1 hypothetical protein GCM10011344_28750 [Dokdonia pacifica]SNS16115.1 hypothetical protein SAMN06265376_107169 [Dokdonia pacifica]